jgi:hypothetical protein
MGGWWKEWTERSREGASRRVNVRSYYWLGLDRRPHIKAWRKRK